LDGELDRCKLIHSSALVLIRQALRTLPDPNAVTAPRVGWLSKPDGVTRVRWYLDGMWLLLVSGLALALRVPNLQLIPAFTDERYDIAQALLIARGQGLPLTNDPPYMGAFWNYLLAGAFWVAGESLLVPRTVMLILGILGVLAGYLLGRAWGGRGAGLLTALLLATSAGHIAFTSRVAWSHSMTPLFVTLGVWALIGAVRRDGSPSSTRLLLAGLVWGLAFQTHPTALAFLPGALVFIIWRQRSLLASWWLYGASLEFVLVNVNLIAYNLMTGFDSVSRAMEQAGEYADGEPLTWWLYVERVGLLLLGLAQSLAGAVDLGASPDDLLFDPGLWPIVLLAAAGVFWQWRRGNVLPGLLVASTVVILPLINGKYNLVPNGRYLAPLLPVLFATVGALLIDVLAALTNAKLGWRRQHVPHPMVMKGGVVLATAFLLIHPLPYLLDYYQEVPATGWTNGPTLATLDVIETYPNPNIAVIVDRSLNMHLAGWGNGTQRAGLELGLTLSQARYRVADVRGEDNTKRLLDPKSRCRDQLVILAPGDAVQNSEVVSRLGLQEPHGVSLMTERWGATYPLYVLPRAAGAPAAC